MTVPTLLLEHRGRKSGRLVACPDTSVQIGRERRPVHAVTADAQQRSRLWPRLVDLYADFDTYQSWTQRTIPAVILQLRSGT